MRGLPNNCLRPRLLLKNPLPTDPLPNRLPSKSTWITLGKVALAAGTLTYLLVVVEPARILEAASTANSWYIAASLALVPVNLFFEALLWQRMARAIVPELPLREAVASLFCGHAAGIITPARVGDVAGRAWYLPEGSNWSLGSAVVIHRLYDLTVVLLVGAPSLYVFSSRHALPLMAFVSGLWVAVLAAGLVLTLCLLRPPLSFRLLRRVLPERASRHLAYMARLTHGTGIVLFLLALLRYGTYLLQFVLLLLAFAPTGAVLSAGLGASLVYLFKYFVPPLTFLDIGVREGLSVYLFDFLGYTEAAAFNSAFLLFCMNLLLPAAIGVFFLMRMRRQHAPNEPSAPSVSQPETR